MRKTISICIAIVLSFFNISMVAALECTNEEYARYRDEIGELNYNLTFIDGYTDVNGDETDGYFQIKFDRVPEGYEIDFKNNDHIIVYEDDWTYLSGDVYNVEFYNDICDEPVKTYTIQVPFYKQYCEYIDCDKNSWFDGTYENKVIDLNPEKKVKVDWILIVVLILLISIIAGAGYLIYQKRKRGNEI